MLADIPGSVPSGIFNAEAGLYLSPFHIVSFLSMMCNCHIGICVIVGNEDL